MNEPITLHDVHGYTLIDHPTHVEFNDQRYMLLVSTIYDDGGDVGPVNTEAVCPNIGKAHAYINRRFTTDQLRVERCDDDALSSYRLFFGDETESIMTVWLQLIPLEDA